MQTNLGWAFGPDMNVLAAELKDGTWQISACGHGGRTCPGCGTRATVRHGWQHRRLQDLPVQGARVTLNLRLGRWRCRSPHCARQAFTERLTAIAAPLARRTCRSVTARSCASSSGMRPPAPLPRSGCSASTTGAGARASATAPRRNAKRLRLGWSTWNDGGSSTCSRTARRTARRAGWSIRRSRSSAATVVGCMRRARSGGRAAGEAGG